MKTALAVLGLVLAALIVTELTMQPASGDRVLLLGLYLGLGVLTVLAAVLVPRWLSRSRSLETAVLLTATVAVGTAAVAVAIAAGTMFISSHDLRLVLVALGLGVALASVLAVALVRPLRRDLASLQRTAEAVAGGSRDVRTGVERRDEVGEVAGAFDAMVGELERAETERVRAENGRRRFLAAIGHDLRTPLTSLRGGLEALRDGLVDDEDRMIDAMLGDVEFLTALVDDLFTLARIESGGLHLARERVDLAELADDAVEALRPGAQRRGVTIALAAAGAVPIDAAPREIGRVLRNLLDNAVRHSPPGTGVTVEVMAGDGDATVRVLDAGPGFEPAFIERALESFTRADAARTREGGGAGLGLAIARGLVEAHGGRISLAEGPGGSVTVRLPRG